MTKSSELLMNQLSEAPSISKNTFNDQNSENFDDNLNFPQIFTLFKFQLFKLFTFSTAARNCFQLFFRQGKHSD